MQNHVISTLVFLVLLTSTTFAQKQKPPIKLPKDLRDKFVYVPAATMSLEEKAITTQGFFLSASEMANSNYNEFLDSLKATGNKEIYKIAFIDSAKWGPCNGCEPYIQHYSNHAAYQDYPVVNITQEGAKAYCQWLTEKLNKQYKKEGLTFEARLPERAEWIIAARGGYEGNPYSWNHSSLFNEEGQTRCNFRRYGAENIHYDPETKTYEVMKIFYGKTSSNADVTAPTASYWPNDYGLYNMNGNVAEWVEEKEMAVGGSWQSTGYDVRNESFIVKNEASPAIGFRPLLIVKSTEQ